MRTYFYVIVILLLIIITGCRSNDEIANKCINQTGTNNMNLSTISGCKLFLCLIDNQASMIAHNYDVSACRSAVIIDNQKKELEAGRR